MFIYMYTHSHGHTFLAIHIDPCVWVGDDVEEHVEVTSSTGDAMRCVEWLCSFTASHVVLVGLMKEKNIEGYTPFMAATSYKVETTILQFCKL